MGININGYKWKFYNANFFAAIYFAALKKTLIRKSFKNACIFENFTISLS